MEAYTEYLPAYRSYIKQEKQLCYFYDRALIRGVFSMSEPSDKLQADEILYRNGEVPAEPTEERRKAEALEGIHHGMTLPNREDVWVGKPGCQRCEVLPRPIRGPGTLHLRLPHTFSLGKILGYLSDSPWQHQEQDGTLRIDAPVGSLAPLLTPIMERLSFTEQRDARAFFQPAGALPQAADYFEIESLPNFVMQARSDWLIDILRENRLFSVFQPIVRCPQNEEELRAPSVYAYECLLRGRVDGQIVFPGPMLELARGADLLFQMDLAARRAALFCAAQHGISTRIFINFSPNAIYNPYSCLDSTVQMVDELKFRREQIVFEILESERLPEISHLKRIVAFYREQGFGVALDDVGSGYSSLSVLLQLRPDFIKLDKELIRGVHEDADKALVVRKLVETACDLGMQVIAEGVETAEELTWLRAQGAHYVQGYLVARPASPPPLSGIGTH